MDLLTEALRATLPPLYGQEPAADPIVYAKFFTPDGEWTWYVTEGSAAGEDFKFFGYVELVQLGVDVIKARLHLLEAGSDRQGETSDLRVCIPSQTAGEQCEALARVGVGIVKAAVEQAGNRLGEAI